MDVGKIPAMDVNVIKLRLTWDFLNKNFPLAQKNVQGFFYENLLDKLELVNLLFLLHPHWQVFVIGLLFQIRPLNQRVQENHHIGPTQRLELY